MKPCNCCVSEDTYTKSTKTCPDNSAATACKCENIPATNTTAAFYSCDCPNRFFFNQVVPRISLKNCSCFGTSQIKNCQCCTTEKDLVIVPKTCKSGESLISCKSCGNVMDSITKTLQYKCNCTTSSVMNSNVSVSLPNYSVNTTTCGCVNSENRATCDCCISNSIVERLRPVCSSDSTSEKCSCRNNSV
jgi:hypothetical protein